MTRSTLVVEVRTPTRTSRMVVQQRRMPDRERVLGRHGESTVAGRGAGSIWSTGASICSIHEGAGEYAGGCGRTTDVT
jgi:hypothetical protein